MQARGETTVEWGDRHNSWVNERKKKKRKKSEKEVMINRYGLKLQIWWSQEAEWWRQGKKYTIFVQEVTDLAVWFPEKLEDHMWVTTCHAPYNSHRHSSSTLITVTHTSSTYTKINQCCSLEGKPAVYFPQGSSSSTVSAQHPHWVNVVSHPGTQKSTVWVCLNDCVSLCSCAVWMDCVLFPLQ